MAKATGHEAQTALVLDSNPAIFAGKTLVVNAPAVPEVLRGMLGADAVFFSTREGCGADVAAPALPESFGTKGFASALLYLPKAKRLRDYLLDQLRGVLPEGATLAVVGHRREGIKSLKKVLGAWGESCAKGVGHHCQLHAVRLAAGHEAKGLQSWAEPITDVLLEREFVSLPGVFAAGRLDTATRLLIKTFEGEPGRLLDLACGAGILGLTLGFEGERCRGRVTLTDVDHLACAAASMAAPEGVEVVAGDRYEGVAGRRFDTIVVNPPFHQGVGTEYEVARGMLREAPKHLHRDGSLWVVANRFLPYREVLEEVFPTVEERADSGRFKVWRAVKGSLC